MTDAASVIDDHSGSRFVVVVDGTTAELVYRRRADRLVLVHTGVPDTLAGHGIAGELVRAAVERAAREGLTVVPLCPFTRTWLENHPDEAAKVDVDWGAPPDD